MNDAESLACRRFVVKGRVQGVFFRASTRDVAVQLSLSGYAKNLSDGSVEVIACGRSEAIDKLAAWLLDGPRMASVSRVEAEALPYRQVSGFLTG